MLVPRNSFRKVGTVSKESLDKDGPYTISLRVAVAKSRGSLDSKTPRYF